MTEPKTPPSDTAGKDTPPVPRSDSDRRGPDRRKARQAFEGPDRRKGDRRDT